MENSIKPFVCSALNCGLSFDTKDHYNIHCKKHEISLNFISNDERPNIFVTDQTPTPTRFLRTCDEIGVFEEILKNPFEQSFHQAIRDGVTTPTMTTIPSTNPTDDTLHTPHIFPNFCCTNDTERIDDGDPVKTDDRSTIIFETDKEHNNGENISKGEPRRSKPVVTESDTKRILSKFPPIAPGPPPPPMYTQPIPARIYTISNNTMPQDQVKQKLKERLLSQPNSRPSVLVANHPSIEIISTQEPQSGCDNLTKVNVTTTNSANRSVRNKKNVEAAKRYRERLKKKQNDLVRKNTELTELNKKLMDDNRRLKSFILNCHSCKAIFEGSASS